MAAVNKSREVPHDVRLIAAASRLIDLHQSRRESGVYAPEIPGRAGYLLSLAFLLLDTLRELEMDRGPSFVAIGEVFEQIRRRTTVVTVDDLDFVVESLAYEREIQFGVLTDDGGFEFGKTKESTPLVEKARGFSQIQLSENGRLLLRITAMKESWLYSDLDAERLVKAIERGQFQDVTRFCRMMILEIASKSKSLSSALERPTLSELREMLIDDGKGIAESLRDATEVIKRACERIFEAGTERAFEAWSRHNPVPYSIGNLQTEVELVMQNVEALSRRFVRFLDLAQRARTTGGEGIPFLSLANQLTAPGTTRTAAQLEAVLSEVMPWGLRPGFFHPSSLVDAIDFSTLNFGERAKPVETYTLEPSSSPAQSRLFDFILRNRALVIGRLQEGPASFSEIIVNTGFLIEADESPADFFGVYSCPEHLDGEGFRVLVGLTGERCDVQIGTQSFTGSDPLMFLLEGEE